MVDTIFSWICRKLFTFASAFFQATPLHKLQIVSVFPQCSSNVPISLSLFLTDVSHSRLEKRSASGLAKKWTKREFFSQYRVTLFLEAVEEALFGWGWPDLWGCRFGWLLVRTTAFSYIGGIFCDPLSFRCLSNALLGHGSSSELPTPVTEDFLL